MRVTRLSVSVVISVLLSGNAIAGALEDCAAAYDRQDYAEAVRLCRPLAEHGDARAQTSLGGMYCNGQGVPQDAVLVHRFRSSNHIRQLGRVYRTMCGRRGRD